MSVKEKRTLIQLKKTIKQFMTAEQLVGICQGVISDVKSGKHADDDQLTPFHTAGMLRQNPCLVSDRAFVEHMVAAATGRILHFMCMSQGIDPSLAEKIAHITNEYEAKAVNIMLSKTMH